MHQERINRVVNAIAKRSGDIPGDQLLFETGIIDSFALTDLVAAIEEEFGITIPDRDLRPANFASIDKIDEYVRSKA